MPPNFPKLLSEALAKISAYDTDSESRGFVSDVLTAEFEADALIKARHLDGTSSLIMSTDADVTTDGGQDCLAVTGFTGKNLKIACIAENTLDRAISFLTPESQKSVQILRPPFLSTRTSRA